MSIMPGWLQASGTLQAGGTYTSESGLGFLGMGWRVVTEYGHGLFIRYDHTMITNKTC